MPKAAHKFEPERDFRFATYAMWCLHSGQGGRRKWRIRKTAREQFCDAIDITRTSAADRARTNSIDPHLDKTFSAGPRWATGKTCSVYLLTTPATNRSQADFGVPNGAPEGGVR
jgi:hypothetical protein